MNVTPEQFPDPALDVTRAPGNEQVAVLAGGCFWCVEAVYKQLDAAKVFDRPIVTELVRLDRFYQAEAYHQDYAARHPLEPYIFFNARPKVEKVKKHFGELLARR